MLRRVHPNSANLFHGRSPLSEICNDLILAQSMPSGAVHTNIVAGRLYPILIKLRVAWMRQNLIDAAACHDVTAKKESDDRRAPEFG